MFAVDFLGLAAGVADIAGVAGYAEAVGSAGVDGFAETVGLAANVGRRP